MAKTLKDYLTFHCVAQTLGSDQMAAALEKKLQEAADGLDERGKAAISDLAYLYACTPNIDFAFDGQEREELRRFKDWWQHRRDKSPADFVALRMTTPHAIFTLWNDAWLEAQRLFDVPPEQLPTDALSLAQKLEAADPNSPLV